MAAEMDYYFRVMKYDTVIFDLDGTLLDTLDDLTDGVNHALREFGFPEATRDEIRARLGYGSNYLIAQSVPGGRDCPVYQQVFDCYFAYYRAHSADKTRPYPGIPELLAELRNKGVRCAIVSNKPHAATQDLAAEYFKGLVETAVGDQPGMVERKPAPDTVLAAMRELGGTPERSVYVGDSEVDIQTAKNAGIHCISVDWGFRTHEQLVGFGAEEIVSGAAELLKSLS